MTMLVIKDIESSGIQSAESDIYSGEAVAFCPHCKALQTVWINNNVLLPTRKFNQTGNRIYHDCNSDLPCRLYITW